MFRRPPIMMYRNRLSHLWRAKAGRISTIAWAFVCARAPRAFLTGSVQSALEFGMASPEPIMKTLEFVMVSPEPGRFPRADLKAWRLERIIANGVLDATGPRKGLRPSSSPKSA